MKIYKKKSSLICGLPRFTVWFFFREEYREERQRQTSMSVISAFLNESTSVFVGGG